MHVSPFIIGKERFENCLDVDEDDDDANSVSVFSGRNGGVI
jgi:hypothetical protein